MRAGRKPKPTALRILEGNRGKRPLPAGEPEPVRHLEPSDAPEWLSDQAREVWEREIARIPRGLLGAHHAELFAHYCSTLAELQRINKLSAKAPPVIPVGSGDSKIYQQSPWASAYLRHADMLRKLASELGLTPTSSPRVAAAPKQNTANPFQALRRPGA